MKNYQVLINKLRTESENNEQLFNKKIQLLFSKDNLKEKRVFARLEYGMYDFCKIAATAYVLNDIANTIESIVLNFNSNHKNLNLLLELKNHYSQHIKNHSDNRSLSKNNPEKLLLEQHKITVFNDYIFNGIIENYIKINN